jgi:hypothetical protein
MHSLEHATFVLRLAVERGEITQRELLQWLGELLGAVADWNPTTGIEAGQRTVSHAEKLNRKISKRFERMMYPNGLESDDPTEPTRQRVGV